MRLNLHEWGDPAAPPLVCLHGVTADGARFQRLAEERLARFRVLAPDLRGHGFSDWEPPWDLDTHVVDLLETLDSAGVERSPILGHSFGGRLALELAALQPERVECLLLLDPAIWVPPPIALDRADRIRPDTSFRSVAAAVKWRLGQGTARTPRRVLEEELPSHLEQGDDSRWRFRFSRSAVVAAYGELAKPPPLARVSAPILLVRAADSEVVPEVLVDVFVASLPDAEVVVVPGGHVVMWDAFDEAADAIQAFLARCAGVPPAPV